MNERAEERREALARVARWCAAGALGFLGWRLAAKALANPEACRRAFRCQGCPLLPECGLPQAAAAREGR